MRIYMKNDSIVIKAGRLSIDQYYITVFLIASLIIINSLAMNAPMISLLLGTCQTMYLLYVLITKDVMKVTLTTVVLLSANIENGMFALGDREAIFYTMYKLPVLRGYHLLLIMMFAIVWYYRKGMLSLSALYGNNGYKKFISINLIIAAMAMPAALFSFLINDNGIRAHTDMWRYMARDAYQMIYIIVIICMVSFSLKCDRKFIERVKELSIAILSATTWAAVVLIISGNYYTNWGTEYYLTCPLILFFSPGLILFLYEEHGIFNLITGGVALLLQLRYTVGIAGTWWLYIFLVVIVFFKRAIVFQGRLKKLIIRFISFSVLITGAILALQSGILDNVSGQVTYKLSSILDVFQNSNGLRAGYNASGGSIQVRVEEMINALIEIVTKPYYLPFGKGYGGTVLHHWGGSNWNISGSTFSDVMIKYETYSAFHIPIAEIIVNFGFFGIVLIIQVLKEFISEFLKKEGNVFIMIGCMWFMTFYSLYYSFNLGVVWMCCGLYSKYNNGARKGMNY